MIGTYYRLSLADEDVGADKAESNSIQGQRGLVEGYIMARPELATEPRAEGVAFPRSYHDYVVTVDENLPAGVTCERLS